MQLNEILKNNDLKERDLLLRKALASYTEPLKVDGSEELLLVILLNMTLKRNDVADLCDVLLAKTLLHDQSYLNHCIDEVGWFHTHNLKYPDIRVSHQRLLAPSLSPQRDVITSASELPLIGWSHDSARINHAKLFCCMFWWQGSLTNLAKLIIAKDKLWISCLTQLDMSEKRIIAMKERLSLLFPISDFPDEVSPYSIQIRIPKANHYIAVTPVVSQSVQAKVQRLSFDNRFKSIIVNHVRASSVGDLASSLAGKIRAMKYLPPVWNSSQHNYSHSKSDLLNKGKSVFHDRAITNKVFVNAMAIVAGDNQAITLKLRRHRRVAALREIRIQLACWLAPLIEWREALNKSNNEHLNFDEGSLEYRFLTLDRSQLPLLVTLLNTYFHSQIQYNRNTVMFAFHPELLQPIRSQIKWLLNKLSRNESCESEAEQDVCYLHFSNLRVTDANALANPYLVGIPSLNALGGWSHNFERRLNKLLSDDVAVIGSAWFMHNYNLLKSKQLPEPSKLTHKSKISDVKRPGIIDNHLCDMTIDLVIKIAVTPNSDTSLSQQISLIQAAMPPRFAGGTLQAPLMEQYKNWVQVYSTPNELFKPLAILPRNGCWIYPTNQKVTSLESLAAILELKPRLRPAAIGYVAMERPTQRVGALEDKHCYVEPAIGVVNCVTPIETRLAGVENFMRNAFWLLNVENEVMLMETANRE